jgi:hypothetical protein
VNNNTGGDDMKIELKCETCGKTFLRKKGEVNRNKKIRRATYCSLSCGGKSKKNLEHIKLNRGTYDISQHAGEGGTPKDEYSDFRWYMKRVKGRHRDHGMKYDMDLEYLKQLWESQNGKCAFSGQELELRTYTNKQKPNSASLDRIDNDKGYVKGNVRFVSVIFNLARNRFSDQDVLNFCQATMSRLN